MPRSTPAACLAQHCPTASAGHAWLALCPLCMRGGDISLIPPALYTESPALCPVLASSASRGRRSPFLLGFLESHFNSPVDTGIEERRCGSKSVHLHLPAWPYRNEAASR